MDLSAAAYEWDHARQLMAIRLAEAAGQTDPGELSSDIYTANTCWPGRCCRRSTPICRPPCC